MWTKAVEDELVKIFSDLIKLDTTNPDGNETLAAEYIKEILQKEGIQSTLAAKKEGRDNLLAEIGDDGEIPIILLSHIDVVAAQEGWDFPAFCAHNENGIIYGRGAIDTKHLTAMGIMAMILLKREGIPLNRKIILIASADEEGGSSYGMEFLAMEHSEFLPKALTISEGGGFVITQNDEKFRTCTCGEKGDCKIELSVFAKDEEKAGLDIRTQNGYHLLETFAKMADYQSETIMCGASQGFKKAVDTDNIENPTLKNLWEYSSKNNLVFNKFNFSGNELDGDEPIKLSINFKFIPGVTQGFIEALMNDLTGGLNAKYSIQNFEDGFESETDSDFIKLLDKHALRLDAGTIMLPMLALGRTDGRFIKRDVYGFSPMLEDIPFSEVLKMVHGRNERISVKSLVYGGRVIYEALRELSIANS